MQGNIIVSCGVDRNLNPNLVYCLPMYDMNLLFW